MISGDRMAAAGKQGAFWYTLEELSRHWERIDVICPYIDQLKDESLKFKVANVHFHPCPRGLWYQSIWIKKKGQQLIDEHAHGVMTVHEYPPFYNGRGAMKLSRLTGVPFALEIHHIVGWPRAASPAELIGRWLSRLVIPKEARAAAVVRVVNSPVKNELTAWGIDEDKIRVVPSFYLDADKLQAGVTEKKFDVVFAGRLVPNKGLDKLLMAMEKLPAASLLVIGDGPRRKYYEQLANNLGIAKNVYFAGWLPGQEDVIEYMQKARVFVMPSLSEGGPRIALEAMACGLPVVATAVGVMPDVIKNTENGWLTTGQPADLAEKIKLLLADEKWRQTMGTEAAKIVERFNRQDLIREYAEFLQNISK